MRLYLCLWSLFGVFFQAYGGFLSSLLLLSHSSVFQCGIAVAPITNWKLYGEITQIIQGGNITRALQYSVKFCNPGLELGLKSVDWSLWLIQAQHNQNVYFYYIRLLFFFIWAHFFSNSDLWGGFKLNSQETVIWLWLSDIQCFGQINSVTTGSTVIISGIFHLSQRPQLSEGVVIKGVVHMNEQCAG